MSAPKRFLVKNISEETILSGEEFNHAKNVLRLFEGSEVTLFDGSGAEYSAVITKIGKSEMVLHTVRKGVSERDPKANLYLLIGALKGDKTELVVQKATELGVQKIGVFSSKYCSAYMNDNKFSRLNRVAVEASKQCLRATVPELTYFDSFEKAVASAEGYEDKLFACEFITESEREISEIGKSVALIVGSEGGFTKEEFEYAKAQGFKGVTLGKRILRAETAAIAFLSVAAYFAGELK
ncbi:MAG: 16S rRNA (uracil(1498)-N(3))-methyltransferase [Clostridia bacterium]|nr:16S rRNA (uracil(1498)-N(3))-methyltransferase [Clostridia bacterium]